MMDLTVRKQHILADLSMNHIKRIVYDAQTDLAYWLYIQAFFEAKIEFNLSRAGDIVTVHLPTSHIVDQETIRQFTRYKKNVLMLIQGVIKHYV